MADVFGIRDYVKRLFALFNSLFLGFLLVLVMPGMGGRRLHRNGHKARRVHVSHHGKARNRARRMNDNCSGCEPEVRVLHVVGGMNQGGIETWLMHTLRSIDRRRFHMDFLVHTSTSCAYDDEVRSLNSRIIPCMDPHRPWEYARNFKQVLNDFGPYDIVHSHVHHFSGFVLGLAAEAGVPVRIAHSHNDTSNLQRQSSLMRRAYYSLSRRCIERYATCGLGASGKAAEALFGESWEADGRWRKLSYSMDLSPFREEIDPAAVRRALGAPESAFIVGNVGRFVTQKNHAFFLRIAAELVRRDSSIRFLLVGEGPLRPTIEEAAAKMGIADKIYFTGASREVSKLMRGAMDLFLLPSLFEGLGLVLIEAQASGIPCIFSDVVPEEADVAPALLGRVSLAQSPERWADAVMEMRGRVGKPDPRQALALVARSPFNIQNGIKDLEALYLS